MENEKYLRRVRDQYELYPYPKRDPEQELNSLFVSWSDQLGNISHYCYKGQRDLRNGGRFLIAGGGTGDAAIHIAEQLRGTSGEVVYIDLSSASMDIARKRAEVRGLDNISWHHGSLLSLPEMNVGKFDVINCIGVLHHLSDPSEGLNALSSVLKDDGCISIMVYAQYGRAAIYQMQELMRHVNAGELDVQECVNNTKVVLNHLPKSNWFKRDSFRWEKYLSEFGDIELFDLFLHSQDRAYTVNQIYQWIESGGLHLVAFTGAVGKKLMYNPKYYISDSALLKKIGELSLPEQQTIAELINGGINTHTFYVSKYNPTLADPLDMELIPYFALEFSTPEALFDGLSKNPDAPFRLKLGENIDSLVLPQGKYTRFIFRYIDGERNLGEILECVKKDYSVFVMGGVCGTNDILCDYMEIFNAFNAYDIMYLRGKNIPAYKSTNQLLQDTYKLRALNLLP